MTSLDTLVQSITDAIAKVYDHQVAPDKIILSETKKEFDGDYTLVVFPFTKVLRQKPEEIGEKIGSYILEHHPDVASSYNVIKGFLNFTMPDDYWISTLGAIKTRENLGITPLPSDKVIVEYSSPNTNKPLHLGHVRNILLGWSTYKILDAVGHEVTKTKVINDRGIAICKSMLAWQLDEDGKTPESAEVKGDHLVGDYYVNFEKRFQVEYKAWQASAAGQEVYTSLAKEGEEAAGFFKGYKNKYFNETSAIGKNARDLLLAWEANDAEVRKLWETMNGWVYTGWQHTYDQLGVDFDSKEYESQTYLLGKDIIEQGLKEEIFEKDADGSVWVDLTDEGLDRKILLRSDGTSVYMTQDLGTAQERYKRFSADRMIYVVGDEQDYHFQVLFETLKKLGESYADGLYHLSYGMVDLPTGKMKGREGTIVDADDLIAEVIGEVEASAIERGELEDLTTEERQDTYKKIGLAALKFFILKVNPKKRMVFDPKESVDIQGQTGPYIQNAYVRIKSILRKTDMSKLSSYAAYANVDPSEKAVVATLLTYPDEVHKAAQGYDPSIIANFAYDLAKKFHKFYHDVRVLTAESEEAKAYRLTLCHEVAQVLEHAMGLLGIEMPERM